MQPFTVEKTFTFTRLRLLLVTRSRSISLSLTHSHSQPLSRSLPSHTFTHYHDLSGVDLVNTHGYPDFMENPQKESYPSKKLIGELYRHLKSRACELQLAHTNNLGENIRPESRFLVPGRFSHILQAEKVYELYCTTMSVHMIRLGLKSGK